MSEIMSVLARISINIFIGKNLPQNASYEIGLMKLNVLTK